MKKILMLSSILLLAAVCAMAQYGGQDTSNQTNASQSSAIQNNADPNETTVQGCLSGSDGSYMLTDKSGTMYQIKGNTSKLQAHLGHTIIVTGTSKSASGADAATQSGSMSNPSDSHPTLMMSSFKHVSPTCSSAAQ